MKILKSTEQFWSNFDPQNQLKNTPLDLNSNQHCVLSIGNFDGLHMGHQRLIDKLLYFSAKFSCPSVVMSFEPHPLQVLKPELGIKRLFDLEDQALELERLGVDCLILQSFSRQFSELSPKQFIEDIIFKNLRPKQICVGYDFGFGADKKGSIDFLKEHASDFSYGVDILDPVQLDGETVSSTKIRNELNLGNVDKAQKMLGRHFYLKGFVEKGLGRGHQISVPTANLHVLSEMIPKPGVYCAFVDIKNKYSQLPAVVNLGYNPTFENNSSKVSRFTVEAHILNFNEDIYGYELKLKFVKRLRDEKKFDGIQSLVSQIKQDIQTAKGILNQKDA